jgi:ubiquinone/menaquinone biosynthesis C-methylase UbiE
MTTPEQTRDAWSGIAAGYDEFVTPLVTHLAEQVLRRIHLRPGMRLLDVAAGTGALSLVAAGLGAQVVATDIAPGMIERLDARARAQGLANLEVRVMDCLDLELEDDSFDVSASQLGVTVIPDLKRGLGEMVRVTKPAGTVLIAALGPPQKAEFFGVFLAALKATVPDFTGPPADPPPPQFQVADPATFRERLAEAGLEDITVETVTFGLEFRSSADLWGFLMSSNPVGRMLVADLTEAERTGVRDVLAGMLRERSGVNGKAVLNLDINIGLGKK